ncbi:hypothetical protein BDN70DRAFT_896439 [Pholiota conissans]|uniref:Uncharacterized protein n=1 Tax=Pholiota conissans TaxID=109636 RepID=A0A9P5YYK7_9AGAR|nr:hypothetical protein BDN70DRAFT_896439 [Pholiota conissans]
MPSLRRSASSPAVRSSPYSLTASRGHGHRRVSVSDTTSRRVLADIEWWRVTDGQCDSSVDHDQEHDDDHRPGIPDVDVLDVPAGTGIHIAIVDVDGPRAPAPTSLPWIPAPASVSTETAAAYGPPTEQFAGLSITPHTPIRRHHALESSTSSLESTPEATESSVEGLALGLSDLDMSYLEDTLPPLSVQRRNRLDMLSPILMRPFTLTDCASLVDDHTTQYADFAVSPLSSAPDFLN